jgi:hypothetical protein
MKNSQTPRIRSIGSKRAEIAQEAGGTVRFGTSGNQDILGLQAIEQIVVDHRRIGLEGGAIFNIAAGDAVARDDDFLDAARIHFPQELRIRDIAGARLRRRRLEHTEEGNQQKRYDCPQGEIT